MKTTLLAYPLTLIAFLALDFVWLSTMSERLYRPALGDMLADQFRLAPAILFYLVYVAGLVYFAVAPALSGGSAAVAAINGAIFGLVAYATYDLTNQATLRHWSTTLTLADMAWGAFVSAAAATTAVYATRAIAGRAGA